MTVVPFSPEDTLSKMFPGHPLIVGGVKSEEKNNKMKFDERNLNNCNDSILAFYTSFQSVFLYT